MTQWDINETRDLVAAKFGRLQLNLARPCLQSVCDRQWYAHYHYIEACSLLDSFLSTNLAEASLLEITLGQDEEVSNDFNIFIAKTGAHVLAWNNWGQSKLKF